MKNQLSGFEFQLLKTGRVFPKGDEWIYELKYDGWRVMAFIDSGKARLVSRNKNEIAEKFSDVAKALGCWAKQSAILDGELVSADKFGRCDFHAIKSGKNLVYIVFDILMLDGTDIRNKSLFERKKILKEFLKNAPGNIQFSEHIAGNGRDLFNKICARGHEGVVAKLINSPYAGGRNGNWLKFRCENYQRNRESPQNDNGKPKISSPEKEVFAGVKKADIADYYQAVARLMLPYLEGRVISQVRCPNGVGGGRLDVDCFFKRKPPLIIASVEELLSEVQMNTIEFHVSGSRAEEPDKPDIMVFDLDPPPGMLLKSIRRGALNLCEVLKELGLESFVKTSGGKGYHIAVPLMCESGWDDFSAFAKNVAMLMEQRWPSRYTTSIRKDKREGRLFIDWLRNTGSGSTTVAPYSIRAKAKEAVSMPIYWQELNKITPDGIGIIQAIKRLGQPDPWAEFFKVMKQQKISNKARK